ncbi:hypothetical protein SBOR_9960 [Sclerotinia borealis F-4128]|uniref:Uncharacterized protein n=1 Tax=Sclerotinia borealis (strain F-4128) TaxID=1432307 RepID=W9C177_SCLBF|nr:hypothetical protein SBOR_9960 [Sclerotinia borealis F-4128]
MSFIKRILRKLSIRRKEKAGTRDFEKDSTDVYNARRTSNTETEVESLVQIGDGCKSPANTEIDAETLDQTEDGEEEPASTEDVVEEKTHFEREVQSHPDILNVVRLPFKIKRIASDESASDYRKIVEDDHNEDYNNACIDLKMIERLEMTVVGSRGQTLVLAWDYKYTRNGRAMRAVR